MKRLLKIVDSELSEEEKLNQLICLIKKIAKQYGTFAYQNNRLTFIFNQKESVYMQTASQLKSWDFAVMSDNHSFYHNKVIEAVTKEEQDKRIINSFIRKINMLPQEHRQVFYWRMIKRESVFFIKNRYFYSNKYYYYLYKDSCKKVSKMYSIDVNIT